MVQIMLSILPASCSVSCTHTVCWDIVCHSCAAQPKLCMLTNACWASLLYTCRGLRSWTKALSVTSRSSIYYSCKIFWTNKIQAEGRASQRAEIVLHIPTGHHMNDLWTKNNNNSVTQPSSIVLMDV